MEAEGSKSDQTLLRKLYGTQLLGLRRTTIIGC